MQLVGCLVMFAVEKWFIVWIDWWGWQKQNVLEVAVTYVGADARFRIFHFLKELFTTVIAAKHGNDAFYMLNVVFKFVRWKDEVTQEQWSGTVLSLHFIITLSLLVCFWRDCYINIKQGDWRLMNSNSAGRILLAGRRLQTPGLGYFCKIGLSREGQFFDISLL